MPTFANSAKLYETSQNYLAAGVSSNLRLAMKPVPIFVKEAEGSRMVDVDGQAYIDYILAYGPQILGHSHPVIVEAVTRQVQRGQLTVRSTRGKLSWPNSLPAMSPALNVSVSAALVRKPSNWL